MLAWKLIRGNDTQFAAIFIRENICVYGSINWLLFVSGPHLCTVKIDARLLIFWWYDGHIVPLCLLALSMIFDLRCAP
jgi:hypothetical protein